MTDQAMLHFDAVEAESRKEIGLELASLTRKDLLDVAKQIALELAKRNGRVTADDVFQEMLARNMHPECLGNAAGSIFRGKDFRFTGEWRKSSRVTNHAHQNRVWELQESYGGVN